MPHTRFTPHSSLPIAHKPRRRAAVVVTGVVSAVALCILQFALETGLTLLFNPPRFTPFPTPNIFLIAPSSVYSNMIQTQMALGFTLPTQDIFALLRDMQTETAQAETTPEVTETPSPSTH